MKQSSIEKLHEESSELMHKHLKGELSARDLIVMQHNLYYEAKEKHKQDIIEAHCDWKRIIDKLPSRSAEEYYKNTYEKELTKQPIKNPIEIGCYICRMDDAYIKMCYWNGTEWLDMWKSTLEGIVKNWIEIPINL